MQVRGVQQVRGEPPTLVRMNGHPVLLVEERTYSREEVRRIIPRLNAALADFDRAEVVRSRPLTYHEFATALRVSPKWLQRRVAAGQIPCYRVGRKVLFEPETLEAVREALRRGDLPASPAVRRQALRGSRVAG